MSVLFAYLVRNLINKKKYVGVTSRRVSTRWAEHLTASGVSRGNGCYTLHLALRRYGKDAFVCETVACATSWGDIYATEIALIAQYGSLRDGGWGYNATKGGEGTPGLRYTNEQREKIRERSTGRRHSPETRARISAAKKGKPVPYERIAAMIASNVGRERSAEVREKIRAAQVGRVVPGDTKQRMSAAAKARTGRFMSETTKMKIAAARRGQKATDATKAKLRDRPVGELQRARMSAAKKGGSLTSEHRQAISASGKTAWTKRRAA